MPRLLVLTNRRQVATTGRDLVGTVTAAVGAGAPAILLRDKDLPAEFRRRLGQRLADVCARAGARLLIAGDTELAARLGAAGVHLAAGDAPVTTAAGLVGHSCHDLAEVRAARQRASYITASPVATTPSKPGYGPALGVAGLARLVAAADGVPVLALGGVTPDNVAAWRNAGAHGIAVMGAVMRAEDPGAAVRQLLE